MKTTLRPALLAILALALLTSCAPRYKITYSNQAVTTSRGKPKLDKSTNFFRFTDVAGQKHVVPAFLIRTIEPYD